MKRIYTSIFGLIISILLTLSSAFAFYSDVPSTHKFYDVIKTLYDEKLLPQEETFSPDSPLKMPDLYKFIITYGNAELSSTINLPFSDTVNDADYSKYLQTAIDLGILRGQSNSELGVKLSVTKRAALEIMFRSLGIGVNQLDRTDIPFKDISSRSDLGPLAKKS
jgi:hypothetical protein